jgi:hypothetical protein
MSYFNVICGGPCHLYGGGAPHHQINTRARGHTLKGGQKVEVLSCEKQAQKEHIVEMQKSKSKEKLEQIHEKMQDMVDENMHGCDELDQVGVAQLQSINTLVSEEMDAASLATSSDVYDAALAPGHDVCGVVLAPGHETCETALAPGRELKMNIQTVDCEEIMGVDQLPMCSIRGGQDIVVQIGQNVELKANPN